MNPRNRLDPARDGGPDLLVTMPEPHREGRTTCFQSLGTTGGLDRTSPSTREVATGPEKRVAEGLARMASGSEISYRRVNFVRRTNDPRTVWHEMIATTADGRSWTYWLARDFGSYRGSFFDSLETG